MSLTVGSLFSGIGGIDLGLERAGMRVIWQSEIDPYCCRVLAKHWPDIPNLGDVTTIDWETVPRVDLICGGYPCQPFSLAGTRAGSADARHLWPFMLDAVRHLGPRWALLENVPGHLSLGFDRVLGDLASCGYDTEWDCIPAAAVGAPHRRDRVFVVAYPIGSQLREQSGWGCRSDGPGALFARDDGSAEPVAHPDGAGPQGHRGSLQGPGERLVAEGGATYRTGTVGDTDGTPEDAHTPTGRPRPATGEPGWWSVEPDVGRVAHGVPHRVERLRALGNAVVPQVAQHIGELIVSAVRDQPPVAVGSRQRVVVRGRSGTPSPMETPAGTHL